MPNEKLDYYIQMAEDTARRITWNQDNWTAFLRTASRLYKYPFQEQLLIFAQRPGATACADYDTWNTRMHRYVRRGGHGIALIDEAGGSARLKYVFDITDTGSGPNSLSPYVWTLQYEHFRTVSDALAQRFGIVADDGIDVISTAVDVLHTQIQDSILIQATEFWENNSHDIIRSVDKSLLAEYDEGEIKSKFVRCAAESAAYMTALRCGFSQTPTFNSATIYGVTEFNTPDSIGELGRAVNECGAQVLRTIEAAVKAYERERRRGAERSNNEPAVRHQLLRGSDREDGSHDRPGERSELSPRGRGLDSGHRPGAGADAGRPANLPLGGSETGLPEGASSEPVSAVRSPRNPVEAHEGRAGAGAGAPGHDDPQDGRAAGRDRGAEAPGSDEVGRDDEQHPEQRGGDNLRGSDLLLNPETTSEPEPDTASSEPEPPAEQPATAAAGQQLTMFPTEAQQVNIIQEAESAQAAPFASSVPQDVIDDFLRHGSNTAKSRMHIIAALYPWHTPDTDWLTNKARERFVNTIRREYHGGYGLIVDGVKYAAWYDDQGLRICRGTSARHSPFSQTIPWNDVLERIWHLYGDGKFSTNVEAMEAHSNECRELALSLLYLYGDCIEESRDKYFPSMKPYVGGGYPAAQARLAEALSDMDKAFAINQNLDAFMKAYDSDRSLLRSHYHKLSQISSRFTSLLVSWENVVPQVAAELSHDPFITEDEVDAALSSGSGVVGGKMRLYNYFVSTPPHTLKEKAEFLKGEYGTGGRSHALSGADNSSEDHDAKGIRLKKRDCPEIAISWPNVAKRIDTLIRMNRYLTPEELAQVNAVREAHYDPEEENAEPDEDALPGEEAEASGDEAFDVATQKALDEEGTNDEAILVGEGNHTLYLYAPNGFKMETALAARNQLPDESIVVAAPTAYISSDYMFAHNLTFLKLNRDIPVEVFDSSMEDQLAAMKNAAASSRSEPWEAYTDAKKTFPDGIVLLRVGDDYEILGEDAERAADALGLMLSSRQTPNGRVPMCRFSMSDLYDNVRKLNEKWNVRAVDYKDENHEQRISEDYPSFFSLLLQGKKTGRTRVERNYKTFARLFPEIVDGTYRYLQLRAPEETGYMPLTIERIGENEFSMSHHYTSNGDLMYDPEMTFRIDIELGTLEPLTFRQDGSPALYQEVYPEPGKWIPKLRNSLSSFTETWLKNIEAQDRVRFRAIAERDGEDVEYSFDDAGNPVAAAAQTEPAELSDISSKAEASQAWQDEHYGSAELYAEYQRIKNTDDFIADGILLVRAGDCYQAYGEDADSVSATIGVSKLNFAMKDFGGADKVTFAGIPDFMLEDYIEELRDKYDVTVVSGDNVKRYLSIDHEAAKAIDEHEAEFGADGWRAFGGRDYDFADEPDIPATGPVQPGEPPAAEESTSPNPAEEALDQFMASFDDPDNLREDTSTLSSDADPTPMDAAASKNGTQHDTPDPVATAEDDPPREMTQDEIDNALRAWNGREESKSAVLQYMAEHGRERGTATWLAGEYGADPAAPLILMTPTGDAEASLSWQKVQLRIAQLIRNNAFMVVKDDPQIVSAASPAESMSDRQAYEIKNLADLKRHITVGAEIVCSFHRKHPEFVGLTRVVSKVQTNGFYSQIKDQPDHKWSVCNYGKGIYSDFEKAGLYRFMQTSNGTSVQLLDRRDPNHDLLMEFKVYPASAVQRDAPAQESQEPQGPAPLPAAMQPRWPVDVGDTIILEDGKAFIVEQLSDNHIQLRDPTLLYPIFRSESYESFLRLMERYPQPGITEDTPVSSREPEVTYEPIAVSNGAPGDEPFDIVMQTVLHGEPKEPIQIPPENFRITDDHLGEGGPKAKFQSNMAAISTLKHIEAEGRNATPEEQEILSRYVGWGGLPEAFDDRKAEWSKEYAELKAALTPEEYTAARASTLNAHYTSPTVIRAIYSALSRMGFTTGNILEPACGVGNFFGLLPQEMSASRLYGVELDSISGRIAQKLYPNANITVAGFETTDRRDFYDVAVGNVPFGQYQVNDRAYNKLGFSIHNYFFAKALDQVRPGGVVAFITSRYTLDAKDDTVRRYLAQRADFLGAIRLPDNAFRANAGTDVVSDIIFLQKRACPSLDEPEWISTAKNIPDSEPAGIGDKITFSAGYPPAEVTATVTDVVREYRSAYHYTAKDSEREYRYVTARSITKIERKDLVYEINQYFLDHPEMVLGVPAMESTQYGRDDYTVKPVPGASLSEQLQEAVKNIGGLYRPPELLDLEDGAAPSAAIPADPDVRNFSYTLVNGQLYFRSGSVMTPSQETGLAKDRIKAMIGLRDCLRRVIEHQLDESVSEDVLDRDRIALNRLYDAFTKKYGLINSKANRMAFEGDSSYYLMTSLENLDEDGNLSGKADIFFKRTIKQQRSVNRGDTASEALAVSIGQKAEVDLAFMAELMGGQEHIQAIVDDLQGVIFKDPASGPFDLASGGEHWDQGWQPADQYLSGNVRKKLRQAEQAAEVDSFFRVNAEALRRAQPKDLDASEIDVRIGSTWIDPEYYRQFLIETFKPSYYRQRHIKVLYSPYTGAWKIEGADKFERTGFQVTQTWGTDRKNAYDIFEDSLNLREVTVYDKVMENGKERRVLNKDETMLASQKQERLRSEFCDWIWKDPDRREALVKKYNEDMNSTRPREYDGKHLVFGGINPEIELREHQLNAIAHVIYGSNSLLAHEVGAGKTFEMVAAAMESKRLGLCSKSLFVVPNHLVDQWASEFLRLYPAANILVTTKKDFQPKNRKRFCSRIATGDYDAIIIGQTQFEKIPISTERQIRLIQKQIDDLTRAIEEMQQDRDTPRWSVKQVERFKAQLEARLKKLQDSPRDDVVTFEELGVDRLFVDESDYYKNLYTYTKMQNVAGISNSSAQKSQDLYYKCRYMDELTGGRGLIFATGTPVSNSMTEVYIIQQYLQYQRMQELGMGFFDAWASRFGETTSQMELAPEGTGYRMRNRFAKFFNLPELMTLLKEVADIKTADQLDLPTPEVEYHNCVAKPTELQKAMMKNLSDRASKIHSGAVDPKEDNMLKITSDGRKLGLDQRIINPLLPDEPGTKVNLCVENVLRIWREGDADKLTQLIFCDISTPKARQSKKPAGQTEDAAEPGSPDFIPNLEESSDNGFTVYDDIRNKLIAGGMPPEQIAYIHDADTEAKKRELFDKMRKGVVRVLLGSTAKMGAGTNVQDRLIASHDLDCPWRPRDLTQRKGRIERQGNQNKKVHVYRYVTEDTFDAYLWQTVENKQKYIGQIMTSKSPVRSMEDVDQTALSFAEIKALCAGDPRIKERMDLEVEVSKLRLMKSAHQSQQFRMQDMLLKTYPAQISQTEQGIQALKADMELLAACPIPEDGFIGMEVRGDLLTDKENAGAALLDACKDLRNAEPIDVGSYRGFKMEAEFDIWDRALVLTLRGTASHRVELGSDPKGNLVRIENALSRIMFRIETASHYLDKLRTEQALAEKELGKPFEFEAELAEKSARLVELNHVLSLDRSTNTQEPDKAKKQYQEVR